MVEHLGIAPSIPAWKAGVYLSTPMLDMKLACRAEARGRLAKLPTYALSCFGAAAFARSIVASEGWSPVRELHPPRRFCRPLPGLIGQRD